MMDFDKPLPVASVKIGLTYRAGIWSALLLALLMVAILQHNNLLYFLVFWLMSFSVFVLIAGVNNIRSIKAGLTRLKPVFAGDAIGFSLELSNLTKSHVHAVYSEFDPHKFVNIGQQQTVRQFIRIDPRSRGCYTYQSVRLYSRYPLDLFLFSAHCQVDQCLWVYPQPLAMPTLEMRGSDSDSNEGDIAGIRSYQPGDKPNHIHWKALAKGQALQTKLFSQSGRYQTIEFTLAKTGQQELERQLSVLTGWIVDAYNQGLTFKFNLDGYSVDGSGPSHYKQCLEMLAVYQQDDL